MLKNTLSIIIQSLISAKGQVSPIRAGILFIIKHVTMIVGELDLVLFIDFN